MTHLTEMTWKELDGLSRERTCFFQVLAPVEEHGHHLPLGTDLFLGEIWTRYAVELLEPRLPDWNFVMLPSLPLAPGSMRGFPGSLYQPARSVRKILYCCLDSLARSGFRHFVAVASHGDPPHQLAVEKACCRLNRKYGEIAFSPLGSIIFSGRRPGNGLVPGTGLARMLKGFPLDFHAGWIETSMIRAERPELVKPVAEPLPDIIVMEREMINPGQYSRKTAGWGHLGYPRLASAELGRELNRVTGQDLCLVTEAFLARKGHEPFRHHFLWKIPFFRWAV
jgi:creatinine amidohydrolase